MTQQTETARAYLMQAHGLLSDRRVDDALQAAREAIATHPAYVDAWSFLGTTLVTRKLYFKEGLEALERAVALAPEDAGIVYGLGWCYEFIAYRLEKGATTLDRDPLELYRLAAECLQRCIDLDPEQALQDDALDLLTAIEVRLER